MFTFVLPQSAEFNDLPVPLSEKKIVGCRLQTTKVYTLLKASSPERHPVQDAK